MRGGARLRDPRARVHATLREELRPLSAICARARGRLSTPSPLPPHPAGPEAYHASCLGYKPRYVPPEGAWYCPSCKCSICELHEPIPNDESILCGDGEGLGCDAAFHLDCVGLAKVPRGTWLCKKCQAK